MPVVEYNETRTSQIQLRVEFVGTDNAWFGHLTLHRPM